MVVELLVHVRANTELNPECSASALVYLAEQLVLPVVVLLVAPVAVVKQIVPQVYHYL